MSDAVSIVVVVLLVLLGPWILVWRSSSRRKRDRAEDQERWRELTSRIFALEQSFRALQSQLSSLLASTSVPSASPAAASPIAPTPIADESSRNTFEHPAAAFDAPPRFQPIDVTPPTDAVVGADVDAETATEFSPSARFAEMWVTGKTAEWARESSDDQQAADQEAVPGLSQNGASPSPLFSTGGSTSEPARSFSDRFKSSLDLEEMLGTNWLNKLGIVILVLGVAFFLAYQLKALGPAGKDLVGFATAAVMLGAGVWFDRRERYRVLARAGIGGGWALAFFTTFAMYHVPAARVLSSQAIDLVLMLVIATAMVVHTLRYRSQVVTGLAFLLAFLTVAISHSNVYSLSAGVVLAAGLVVIVLRMQWFELEVFGILASYLNHYLWLRPIIEPMHGKRHPFTEFTASAGILALYWLIFRVSYVLRRPSGERGNWEERVSTAAALLNTTLLLGLFKYQSTHPELAFWALLGIGAIETLLAQLPVTRRRRTAVIVLSTLGVVLLVAAFPFRYSGMRLSVLWLMEAEALLLIGVWTKEIVFRRLGMLGAVLVSGQMIAVDAAQIFGSRIDDADLRPDFRLAIIFMVAAAVFYANAHWLLRRWSDVFSKELDRRVMQRLSYVAAVMLLIGAWIAFPESWTAVAWCLLGLGLVLAAGRFASTASELLELRYQANFLALVSVLRVLAINLESTDKYHGVTVRLMTIALVSALLYVTSRWSGGWTGDRSGDSDLSHGVMFRGYFFSYGALANAAYSWSASSLLALLAWYELRPVSVANAWLVGGLILLEFGLGRRKLSLRLQAYVAFASSFLRIFFVNLNAEGIPGEISPRFYTVVPLALGFFYAHWRLHESSESLHRLERRLNAGEVCCWLGTLTFAALIRFELAADWVSAAWAALALALLVIAWRSERRVFLYQGLLIAIGVLFRTVLHNFYERSYFPAPALESRWVTVGAAVGLLFLSLPFAFKLRKKNEPSNETGLVRLIDRKSVV